MKRRPPPGSQFRLQFALNRTHELVKIRSRDYQSTNPPDDSTLKTRAVMDEVVISPFLHVEQMNRDAWWIRVCNRCFWVYVGNDGVAHITSEEVRE